MLTYADARVPTCLRRGLHDFFCASWLLLLGEFSGRRCSGWLTGRCVRRTGVLYLVYDAPSIPKTGTPAPTVPSLMAGPAISVTAVYLPGRIGVDK
jgi:hypothetical protein